MRRLFLIGVLFLVPCIAQPRGGEEWGPQSWYGRRFDPAKMETVTGEVVKVESFIPRSGMGYGVHLILKTEKDEVTVHLGPSWYIENQPIQIAVGDQLTVTGSMVTIDGNPVLIAIEVQRGDEVLTLRNKTGTPAWSGWKRLPQNP